MERFLLQMGVTQKSGRKNKVHYVDELLNSF